MAQIAVIGVLDEVVQICRECPMQTMVRAYVRAARQLCNKSRWLVRNIDGVTVIDTQVYTLDLGADTDHEVIGIRAMSIDQTGLGTSFEAMTESFSGGWDPHAGPDVPEFYQYVPESQVGLSPTPDGIYTLLTTAVIQPVRTATTIDETLLASWDYALQAGALAYLLALPRTPWTNPGEAQVLRKQFEGHMNQAASSAARGYNAGAATTDRNGRTSGQIRTRILPI